MKSQNGSLPVSGPFPFSAPNLANVGASLAERRVALAVALSLVVIAIVAILFRTVRLMPLVGTVPAQSLLCLVAYGLTAYALLRQFRSNGHCLLLTVGCAYVVAGLLQIPHALAIPNAWVDGLLIGNAGTAAWSASLAHLVFPLFVGIHVASDPDVRGILQPERRARWLLLTLGAAACVAALLTAAALDDSVLPRIYADGHFLPVLGTIGWGIFGANVLAVLAIWMRTGCRTVLQLWLVVFLIGSGLDSLLFTVSPARYVVSWYANEAYGICIAVIVLAVLWRQAAMLYRQVANLAAIDQLTGLPNRRSLDSQLEWILRYSERNSRPVAVVMVDIDVFKAFNDTYGHAAGDEALKRVAGALSSALRSSDVVARYGGEEFLAILPDATREGTTLTVERMRAAIEGLNIPHRGSEHTRLTGSFGAAVGLVGNAAEKRDLVRTADEALYAAKRLGRNRSVVVPYARPSGRAVRAANEAEQSAPRTLRSAADSGGSSV
jgi:diguanylate cyclase (GGDEF)-like protein